MKKYRNTNWVQEVEVEDIRKIKYNNKTIWLHDLVYPAASIVVIIPSSQLHMICLFGE